MYETRILGVIYDLDDTIIDTGRFHQDAWELTSREYGFALSGEELYLASKGISSKKTLEKMLPVERHAVIDQAAEAKFRYMMNLMEHEPIEVFPGFEETFNMLRGYMLPGFQLPVGICTSARRENVEALQRNQNSFISSVLQDLTGRVVWKEMYTEGKPAAEPLLLASRMIGVDVNRVLYVGDAHSDYQCAQNAEASFSYFCGENAIPDVKIPSTVPRIKDHRELIEFLE